MTHYKILIAYDGTDYSGWQTQPNSTTIQETIETALSELTQQPCAIFGAGRTDAGVHARGQTAHTALNTTTQPDKLLKGLNALLPLDIRILSLEEVPATFHARFSAQEKTYTYRICTAAVQNPLQRRFALHYTYRLDLALIESSLALFTGTKNFRSFANEASRGAALNSPIKTLHELSLTPTEDGFVLTFRGSGFLYKMVRNITGTLLDIGRGKLDPKLIPEIFLKEDRSYSGTTAPPQGLTLEKILYPII